MTGSNWGRLALVVLVGLLLQACVLDEFSLLGAHADVMVLIAACCGMAAGSERGAVGGFVVGLAADLIVNTPYGLSPLTFVIVGFATGLVRESVAARDVDGSQVLVTIGAAAAGTILYAVIGAIAGQHGMLGVTTLEALLAVTLGAVVLGYPTLRVARWAFEGTRETSGLVVPHGGSAAK